MLEFPEWPKVQPFERDNDADPEGFKLLEDYRAVWKQDKQLYRVTVPAGFEYNEASTPRIIWAFVSPLDLGPGVALVHDWFYNWQGKLPLGSFQKRIPEGWQDPLVTWSRKDVDRLMARMMRSVGVAKWRRRMAYRAVRAFGLIAWKNAKNQ